MVSFRVFDTGKDHTASILVSGSDRPLEVNITYLNNVLLMQHTCFLVGKEAYKFLNSIKVEKGHEIRVNKIGFLGIPGKEEIMEVDGQKLLLVTGMRDCTVVSQVNLKIKQ